MNLNNANRPPVPRKMPVALALKYIKEQHQLYYDRLQAFCLKLALGQKHKVPPMPEYTVVDCVFERCGQYDTRKHTLQYSLPYCVYVGEEYHEVVAHEMAHAFQRSTRFGDFNTAHGSTFLWMLCEARLQKLTPEMPNVITHDYPVRIVDRLAEELKAERGGSDHITLNPVRRKSLRDLMEERNRNNAG